MDRNDSNHIIKSGVRHAVQVAQGTKNAKSVRNVVTSDVDAPIEERIVGAQDTPLRDAAPLQGGAEALRQLAPQGEAEAAAEAAAAGLSRVALPEEAAAPRPHSALAPEPEPAAGAAAGPLLTQHARGQEDAFAAKQQPLAEQDLRVQQPAGAAPAERLVSDDAAAPIDNRQRIERVQAEANRVRLEQGAPAAENRVRLEAAERAPKAHEVTPAAPPPARAEAPPDPEAGAAPADPESELPPEVAANLGSRSRPVPSAKESDLMARLRAIKSNMSVTENRLTQLHQPEPPKS